MSMRLASASRVVAAIAALAGFAHAGAQTSSPTDPAVDSARAARAAWRQAMAAEGRGDVNNAYAAATRAAAAWPEQPVFVWGRAQLAARSGDSTGLRAALTDYAALGLGQRVADTIFNAYRGAPWFAELDARLERNTEVMTGSTTRATLSDSTIWPEGMDYEALTGSYFVTSVRHRTIVERTAKGHERDLWPRDTPGIGGVFAVRVDMRRGVLWATMSGNPVMSGYQPGDSALASLLEVRIADGKILRRFDLPPTHSYVLGDVSLAPNGDVYVSDSNNPTLYRLSHGADHLESITHPLFRSLQGTAVDSDSTLFVADYSHGLLHVNFNRGTVTRLVAPPHATTLGCDGIVWHAKSRSIVAVQNGVVPARIMRFRVDPTGTRITSAETIDRHWDVADEPTIGTLIGDNFVYVANSQWEKFTEDGTRKPEKPLTAPVLLSVPLR